MSPKHVIRQISWSMVWPQLAVIAALIFLASMILRPEAPSHAILIGLAVWMIYSTTSRLLILHWHYRAMRRVRQKNYQQASRAFRRSYDFLSRHPWIDHYRWIVLMSPSSISYREMDLFNVAFCQIRLGHKNEAAKYYKKLMREFPDSHLAQVASKMIPTLC